MARQDRGLDARTGLHQVQPNQILIRALRARFHLSQAVLAAALNTSSSTVRKWEVGDKRPSGPSQKLLNLIDRKGLEAVL
nr:helix-turn-helix domain-containing protein [Cupriavidus oxalaticus]